MALGVFYCGADLSISHPNAVPTGFDVHEAPFGGFAFGDAPFGPKLSLILNQFRVDSGDASLKVEHNE